jgi:hypothetical protein
MGLFSFLFGGKKKDAAKPTSMEKELRAVDLKTQAQVSADAAVAAMEAAAAAGMTQAKLRLKLAASLRAGQAADAYAAATGLADIQARAGRHTAARQWREQAEKIRAGTAA